VIYSVSRHKKSKNVLHRRASGACTSGFFVWVVDDILHIMPFKNQKEKAEYFKEYNREWRKRHPNYSSERYNKNIKPFTRKPKHLIPSRGREFTRELVRIRDKHTCQDCHTVWTLGTRRFDVHHLNGLCGKKSKGYDRKGDLTGLITLCHKCHYRRSDHTMNA
jgi:5-methylcytosine-specific restriction endonuclease McrA